MLKIEKGKPQFNCRLFEAPLATNIKDVSPYVKQFGDCSTPETDEASYLVPACFNHLFDPSQGAPIYRNADGTLQVTCALLERLDENTQNTLTQKHFQKAGTCAENPENEARPSEAALLTQKNDPGIHMQETEDFVFHADPPEDAEIYLNEAPEEIMAPVDDFQPIPTPSID